MNATPQPTPPARTWCAARVRLTPRPGEPSAPCMLADGHAGPCNAATTVVENHAPKRPARAASK